MRTLPIDTNKIHNSRKVFFADSLGRIMWDAWDGFESARAARVYWWMLARQNVRAFLDCGLDGQESNEVCKSRQEPQELKRWIDQAEREFLDEGGDEGAEWGRMFTAWACNRGAR